MFKFDTGILCHSHTQTWTHTYVKAWVPQEKDFVNVKAIQWWQQAMSAVKWALCWAECNDSQDNWSRIWKAFHFVVMCWGRVTGELARKSPSRGCSLLSPCVFSLGNIFPLQHFYLCQLPCWMLRDIGSVWTWVRGSSSTFLVIPAFLASWHLSAEDSGPETKQRIVVSQTDDSSVKAMFK